ncbi:hypothetical protein BG005_011897 [Podila minutissima]|nr:hypothetical protein BG005_011897 [Podila minutissima]
MSAFHPDCILQVHKPILTKVSPGNSIKFAVEDPTNLAKWYFTLTRAYDILNVLVTLPGYTGPSLKGDYMHIIPMNGGKPVMFDYTAEPWNKRNKINIHVHTEIVQHGDVYGFHFVQANTKELPWYFLAPANNKPQSLPGYEESVAVTSTNTADSKPQTLPGYEESVPVTSTNIMSALLCDIYSVDTQIVFGSTRAQKEISLWAHRTILSKFPAFDALIKQASIANRDTILGPLTLTVTKVSLPVFATLLRFLYVGEVQRLNFPEHFAICRSNWWGERNSTSGSKDRHLWQPLDLNTPLSVEPVTWEELLDAATIYKLDALRAHCRAAIKSEFNGR